MESETTETREEYSLAWKGHINYLKDSLIRLLHTNELCDVTLYTEGGKIGAHKVLLAACSEYFSELFKELQTERPVIVIKGVEYEILLEILKFMYHGEVSIELPKLSAFLETANFLRISGLTKNKVVKTRVDRDVSINESDQACNTENSSDTKVSASPSYVINLDDESADRPPEEPASFSAIPGAIHQKIFPTACTVEVPQLNKIYKIHSNQLSTKETISSPSIEHAKYSIESPPRTGEWTSGYDNMGEGNVEKSPSKILSHQASPTSPRRKRFKSERRTSLNDISEIEQEEFEFSGMENEQSMQKAMLKTSFDQQSGERVQVQQYAIIQCMLKRTL